MIHPHVLNALEKGKVAINELMKLFPYSEGHREIGLKLSLIWGLVINLFDELKLRDTRLDKCQKLLGDLLENVPEAREYYQKTMDNGQLYVDVFRALKDTTPKVRY